MKKKKTTTTTTTIPHERHVRVQANRQIRYAVNGRQEEQERQRKDCEEREREREEVIAREE